MDPKEGGEIKMLSPFGGNSQCAAGGWSEGGEMMEASEFTNAPTDEVSVNEFEESTLCSCAFCSKACKEDGGIVFLHDDGRYVSQDNLQELMSGMTRNRT